jgi:acetyltransferase-like isoleucine patch superfamily enzyme
MIDPTHHFETRLRKSPHLLLPAAFAWLRGWWYRVKFFLLFRHFRAGKYFRVYGPLNVSGPGSVTFGKNCLIISNAIKPVCIRTFTREACVTLGDHAGLNGTSIQCVARVEIGDLSNIADAYISDTAAHAVGPQRRLEGVEDVPARPVIIGSNVWVSVSVVILDGVHIGDNSVVGACSLVRKDIPADVFVAGNPLQVIRQLK